MPHAISSNPPIVRRGTGGWSFAFGCALVLGASLLAMKVAVPLFKWWARDVTANFFNLGATAKIKTWGERKMPPDGVSGVVFGDSVFAPLTSDKRLVVSLGPALQQAGLNVKLLDLTQAGFSAYQFYYLSSRVLDAGPPDFAVVEVNLRTFAHDWYENSGHRFAPMAMGLSAEQVWRVHQALATQQVGFLTPFEYRLDSRVGIFSLLDGVRAFGLGVLDSIGTWANGVLGLPVQSAADINRAAMWRHVALSADHAHLWYGRDFVVSPTAEVLRAFSEHMRAAGVTILYVVAPVQRRRLRQLGIQPDDFHARTERLREMLGASPEQWLEATELYQSTDFVDGVHVHGELIRRMARPLVERLVPMMTARQRARAVPAINPEDENVSASSAH